MIIAVSRFTLGPWKTVPSTALSPLYCSSALSTALCTCYCPTPPLMPSTPSMALCSLCGLCPLYGPLSPLQPSVCSLAFSPHYGPWSPLRPSDPKLKPSVPLTTLSPFYGPLSPLYRLSSLPSLSPPSTPSTLVLHKPYSPVNKENWWENIVTRETTPLVL
jgi:hypothetical protein